MAGNKPEQKIRVSQITATIWKNERTMGEGKNKRNFTSYTTDLQRSYKDNDGNWQNTNSLNKEDIPKAIKALDKAWEWIYSQETTHDDTTKEN